jgi:hypothetical protein
MAVLTCNERKITSGSSTSSAPSRGNETALGYSRAYLLSDRERIQLRYKEFAEMLVKPGNVVCASGRKRHKNTISPTMAAG